MTLTTLSSREFDQDVSGAKRAAEDGPVVITDRGEPAYVLLQHDHYLRLTGESPKIRQLLDQPGTDDVAFDPPRFGSDLMVI